MNFQYFQPLYPLKVLIVNPLVPAARLTIVKIMSGLVFGNDQLIDLILLVYCNEKASAEAFKLELSGCAFSCHNSIEVSSDLPSISDADVFCFITNFPNPNSIDFDNMDSEEQFDTLYLIIKIANSLSKPISNEEKPQHQSGTFKKKSEKPENKLRKPILIADGLVPIDILMSMTQNVPHDVFFCPSSIPELAKSIIGDHLKVQCNDINEVLVWAANDKIFHAEVEKPLILHDIVGDGSKCDWEMVGNDLLKSSNLDHTQFSESWMKKELIEKMILCASKNPYGCIYKAAEMAKTLKVIWKARSSDERIKVNSSIGVISDGSLGTLKGYPYVLPLVLGRDTWNVNNRFEEDSHLKQEIKRMNKIVTEQHQRLIPYCKKFLQENVINQAFIATDDSSVYSMTEHSSRLTH